MSRTPINQYRIEILVSLDVEVENRTQALRFASAISSKIKKSKQKGTFGVLPKFKLTSKVHSCGHVKRVLQDLSKVVVNV